MAVITGQHAQSYCLFLGVFGCVESEVILSQVLVTESEPWPASQRGLDTTPGPSIPADAGSIRVGRSGRAS